MTKALRTLPELFSKIKNVNISNYCKNRYIKDIGYLMMKYNNENEFDWFSKLDLTGKENVIYVKNIYKNDYFECNILNIPKNEKIFNINENNSAVLVLGGDIVKKHINGELEYNTKINKGNLFYNFENEAFLLKGKENSVLLEINSIDNNYDNFDEAILLSSYS